MYCHGGGADGVILYNCRVFNQKRPPAQPPSADPASPPRELRNPAPDWPFFGTVRDLPFPHLLHLHLIIWAPFLATWPTGDTDSVFSLQLRQ